MYILPNCLCFLALLLCMTNNDRINVIVTAIITKPTGTAIPPILSAAVVGPELAAVVVGVAVALVVLGGQPVFAIKEYKYRKIDCVVMNSQIVAVMSGARLVEELSRRDLPTGYMQVASGRGVSKPVANQTVHWCTDLCCLYCLYF